MKVKCLPSNTEDKKEMKDVYVDIGIQPYVEIVNNIKGLYTVGSCEGHIFPRGHELYDNNKKTIGWLQLSQLTKNYDDLDKLYKLLNKIDDVFKFSDNKNLVCVIDPFSEVTPMDYCKVFMSKLMWEHFWSSSEFTLMGIDEMVILNDDGSVIGVYKNIYQSALCKCRSIMRNEPSIIMQI